MRKSTFAFVIIILCAFGSGLTGCNSNQNSNEKIYASSISVSKPEKKIADADFHFLVDAYSKGLLKIQMADEALIRSTSTEAKQLATSIKDFYSAANADIETIAEKHDFTLPMDLTNEQKITWKSLVKERGWNFDAKFREMFEEQAQKDLAFYSAAESNDEMVQAFVAEALKQTQQQLQYTQALCQTILSRTFDNVDPQLEKPAKSSGTINAIAKR